MKIDELRFRKITDALRGKLHRHGLKPVPRKIKGDGEERYAVISKWGGGWPEVALYAGSYFSDAPMFWCGFQSSKNLLIDRLKEGLPGFRETPSLSVERADFFSADERHRITESQGVVHETGYGYSYFGKYLLSASTDEEIIDQATRFIVNIIEYLDPALAERRDIADLKNRSPTERRALILARRGQGEFRRGLIQKWQGCAVLRTQTPAVLRASHIKPWSKSNDDERLDPENGLLLTATLDALFDRFLISFDEDETMLVSRKIALAERELLSLNEPKRLSQRVTQKQQKYLAEHRKEAKERWGEELLRCGSL